MSLVLVDTDILIDAAAQVEEAIECLKYLERQSTLAVCAVTEMELWLAVETRLNYKIQTDFSSGFRPFRSMSKFHMAQSN